MPRRLAAAWAVCPLLTWRSPGAHRGFFARAQGRQQQLDQRSTRKHLHAVAAGVVQGVVAQRTGGDKHRLAGFVVRLHGGGQLAQRLDALVRGLPAPATHQCVGAHLGHGQVGGRAGERLDQVAVQLESFGQQPLPFDQTQQTHVTAEYLAIGSRHFTQKPSRRYPQLRVLKYTRNVFYNNRFDDALLEMRGLVLDEHQRIIVRPFKKVFNYSERTAANSRYPIRMHDDMLVDAVVKVNGFLGCATYVDLADDHPSRGAAFERQVLYSTTGSLDSDFAQLAAKHCAPYEALFRQYPNHTFLFEITDPGDVHIIREPFGATLIGLIEVASGRAFREAELDELAAAFNAEHAAAGLQLIRPQTLRRIRFGDLKQQLKSVQHEGFMVFDAESQALLFKLKSPYYLISKFFGRSNANNLGRKLDKRHVDEEYYPLLDHLRQHRQTFNAMGEQEKIAFIQAFLRGV